ncbi:CipC1 protein [Melanogaster broomeanus]|nr:CipC1 protein [Melanogaster broomeanus]
MFQDEYDEPMLPVDIDFSRVITDRDLKVVNAPHQAKLSHELIAAAASYEAMKAWNEHREKNGEPASHATAKEFLAAASGFFIDHIVETKGLDYIDTVKAKHQAKEHHEQHFQD